VFVAGPPVVKAAMPEAPDKEELGGSHIHARNGTVDNEVASEDEALDHVRRFLSYMPSSVWDAAPRGEVGDDPARRAEELISIIPRERRKAYDARRMVRLVLDEGSFFEIGRLWGRSLITGFGRLDGWPVGVLAGDPMHYAAGLTADASDKLTRFVDLCDTFHLPAVNFVDQPGFVIGTTAERASTIRKGSRALVAVYQASVPWISIIVRKVFGVAGAAHGNAQKLNYRYAWPSGDWGSLPLEGGIEAAFKRQLAEHPDPAAFRQELETRYNLVRSPFRTAESFNIEEIIDPRDTRPLLCDWVDHAHHLVRQSLGPKTRGMRP
jgi:acetyl-CoA carboxylase carboxyltransferase component